MLVTEDIASAPLAPQRLQDTGLSADLVLQLVAKTLHLAGELSGFELADRLGVPFGVIAPAIETLKHSAQCEIAGGAMLGAASFQYRLTDAGLVRAALFLEQNHYVGALPVPLVQYTDYVNRLGSTQTGRISRDAVHRAFSHLVLSDRTLDQLGPAIASRHSWRRTRKGGNSSITVSVTSRRSPFETSFVQ